MTERSLRIGPISCTFSAGGAAAVALDDWLGADSAEPPGERVVVAFEFISAPPPAPVGEQLRAFGGTAALWRRGGVIDLRTEPGIGGRVDLSEGRGQIWIGAAELAPRAVHACLRPLVFLAAGRFGWHGLHAAAVVVGGRAVLLLGDSGAGKSTMGIRLAAAGWPLLADDVVFVDEDTLEVTGTPEPLRLDPAQAVDLGLAGVPHVGGKVTVAVPSRRSGPVPIRWIGLVDPARVDAGGAEVTPATAGDAMVALLRAGLLTVDPEQDRARLATLARLASTCRALRLRRPPAPPSQGREKGRHSWGSTVTAT